MAWGIKTVADKNKAAADISSSIPIPSKVQPTLLETKLELEILSPVDGLITSIPTIVLNGSSAPFTEVQIDDKVIKADMYGNFSTKITLDEGDNEIVITANNEDGDYVEKTLLVVYEPAE